jgi:NAD+ kinase
VYLDEKYEKYISLKIKFVKEEDVYILSDVILSLGGDGTLIGAARNAAVYGKPIMGINLGHLGFLSELEKDDLSGLNKLISGNYTVDERMMLNCKFTDTNGKEYEFDCLNDIIISRGSYPRMIDFELNVGNETVEKYMADGMIVSTSTGSTAYSLSAGGPVVEPNVELIITDIEMPLMDGHRLTKLVKTDETLKDIPVVIFSSLVNDEMRRKGEQLGADAQLSKPEIGNLVRIIDGLLDNQ